MQKELKRNPNPPSRAAAGSETPRTDREADWGDGTTKHHVSAAFARQLERELNAANRRIEDLMRRNNVDEALAFGRGM